MTAPPEARAPSEPLTLSGRLGRLAGRLRTVADERGPVAEFAEVVLGQLRPAVDAAAVQADELEMLRAQAADRERARAGLQSALGDIRHLAVLIDGTEPGALSKPWLVENLRVLVARAEECLKSKEINHA